MLVRLTSAAILGISAVPVSVEIHTSRGICFSLVGLPDNAVRESHERIRSALQMNGMDIPRKQVVINMAPGDLRKEGTGYDLPLSVGLMAAGEHIPCDALFDSVFVGELSLDGSLQPIKGALSIATMTRNLGIQRLFVPWQNAREAAVVEGIDVYGVRDIRQIRSFLNGEAVLPPEPRNDYFPDSIGQNIGEDFSEVKGQEEVKRAIEVACSGGHNLIMIGAPGSGKTMMAKCIPGILPPMTIDEALETTMIHSVSGKVTHDGLVTQRPFRAPHHTISPVAMIGGGSQPQPGEISLSHNGVLFLDELPEFSRSVLEVLRQPLEDRKICISRAKYTIEYPASMMLVASMNPCPCGYYNHPHKECICTPMQIQKYSGRISGPLLDRFDIQVEIMPVEFEHLNRKDKAEKSRDIRDRVVRCREIQAKRFATCPGIFCNAQMNSRQLTEFARLDRESEAMLKYAMEKLQLSARAYNRILKVARTIADMDGSEIIQTGHVAEAIQYRKLDRASWGNER